MSHCAEDLTLKAAAKNFPDQTPYRGIYVVDVGKAASAWGLIGREIEIAAHEDGIIPEPYAL